MFDTIIEVRTGVKNMADLNDEQNMIFQFLVRHAGKRFTAAEIATQLGMEASLMLFSPYARLRQELDQLVDQQVIESTIEDGETKYFVSK